MMRGRPPLAAQSIDEALRRLNAGEVPPRSRNEVERLVFSKRRGRKRSADSITAQAAQLAWQLYRQQRTEQPPKDEAAAKALRGESVKAACELMGLDLHAHRSNVRRYMNRMFRPVSPAREAVTPFGRLPPPGPIPLVASIDEMPPPD